MSRFLFAFPVIAALAISPSPALAQHYHGGHHGGGWHGGGYHGGGWHGGGYYHHHHHPDWYPYGGGYYYHHHHPDWYPYGGGAFHYGSGYQGYYPPAGADQPQQQSYQPQQQSYQIPPGYEGYPDGTVINYGGSNYMISGGVMYPAG